MLVSIKRYINHYGYIDIANTEELVVVTTGRLLNLSSSSKSIYRVYLNIDKVNRTLSIASRAAPITCIKEFGKPNKTDKIVFRQSFLMGHIVINDNNDTRYLEAISKLTDMPIANLLLEEVTDYVFNKPNT